MKHGENTQKGRQIPNFVGQFLVSRSTLCELIFQWDNVGYSACITMYRSKDMCSAGYHSLTNFTIKMDFLNQPRFMSCLSPLQYLTQARNHQKQSQNIHVLSCFGVLECPSTEHHFENPKQTLEIRQKIARTSIFMGQNFAPFVFNSDRSKTLTPGWAPLRRFRATQPGQPGPAGRDGTSKNPMDFAGKCPWIFEGCDLSHGVPKQEFFASTIILSMYH